MRKKNFLIILLDKKKMTNEYIYYSMDSSGGSLTIILIKSILLTYVFNQIENLLYIYEISYF